MKKCTEENSLQALFPEVAKEWHPFKNKGLMPTDVTAFSNKKVWWQCDKEHEWQAVISNRSNGKGCPYCVGQLAIPGETDLTAVNPKLASEWHPSKNGTLTPFDITAFSHKKVWWQCKNGHEWQAIIVNRSNGNGCPYCAGRLAIPGETDLTTVNPKLASEWHPLKNGTLTPSDITAFSNKKVWWKCEKEHKWQATISSRSNGNGCPYCAGRLAIPGETDLATANPKLASEWHPSKNGILTSSDVTTHSDKKIWWRCDKEHEWQAKISDRSNGSGCPYCAGKLAIPGETDFATVNPKLAEEWHPTKNGKLKPADVTFSSGRKVWWMCEHGHEWQALISDRNRGRGCPFCANKNEYRSKSI